MRQRGFTLVEILISLFIGAILLGGVVATYVSMRVTTKDTMAIGELQEIGRLSLTLLRRDLEQIGFWGTFYDQGFSSSNSLGPANPPGDCFGGLNNGSFPAVVPTNFRPIYAAYTTSGSALGCVVGAKKNTEILQLKFLEGDQITNGVVDQNKYYFIAQQEQAIFVSGPSFTGLPNVNATLWPYSHHVYFIEDQEITLDNNKVSVPVLRRKRLTVNGDITTETVIEGVEDIRYLFGIDIDGDSRVDSYRSVSKMTASDWERSEGVLTVQVIVLVRSLEPDPGINLKNQTYTLGNDGDKVVHTFSDNYRRTVFSTTVQLYNMGSSAW
ncbi:pilus assembly protein PilW [Pseudoalteromonas luteoviolacea]|uniref:Pilus assembly protein PilW n=1 Tax=Pseudoalteromonas luteoviolacea TaxID=43657 RepID=A0A1C0TMQ5_9GAMM|nr:PilW family protein [Pseudoalteromonas luteoviolacea]MBQ4812300.1 PilW family protein [Pseudoalteromonas luteoviolacea]OCQ19957.1 pilus assembly protein PilW [Pseudoalteromonas luteoviolacea]